MTAQSEINKIKKRLTSKAESKGLWEDFGQKEHRKLKDKYGSSREVDSFFNWAINYTPKRRK